MIEIILTISGFILAGACGYVINDAIKGEKELIKLRKKVIDQNKKIIKAMGE